jgi:TfoX/Sxy family transcriptional regulator of competence genes
MTEKNIVIQLTDAMRVLGDIRFKPMFGEWGVYINESFAAIIGEDLIFLKVKGIPDASIESLALERREPYPGAKNYAILDPERLEDEAFRQSLRDALLAAGIFKL